MIKTPVAGGVIAALVLTAGLVTLGGSTPKFFQASTQDDFLQGDVENLSIDTRGQLSLGPVTELVYETAAPFIWSVLALPDGTLHLGTGNGGRVFRVDPQGKGAPFFTGTEMEVHALAPGPDGSLYVGTSPDGKIYKVDRQGASTLFFDPQEKYIWALAADPSGNLFAGTGDKGTVYRITPDGKGSAFYRTKATHAMSLALDKSGNLLVGTESPGRVLRVDAQGKGFLLLDTPFQEIRALRFDNAGTLYVAAVNGRPPAVSSAPPTVPPPSGTGAAPADAASPAPVPSVSTEITTIAIGDTSTASGGPGSTRDDRRVPKGAIYRVPADGLWDQIWESADDFPYDVTFDGGGRLILATGNKGKIYRLEGDPLQPTLIARAAAQQVTALHRDARGRLHYATANPGKVFRLSTELAASGFYESGPQDAKTVATWGNISWRGTVPADSKIELATRSGNSDTPDETWSGWSGAYSVADGSVITSPRARYIQWRATLTGKGQTPVLTSVTLAYLQRNARPQVRAITVYPAGIVFQKPYSTGDPDLAGFDNQTTPDRKLAQEASVQQQGGSSPPMGRRTYQKALQTLTWRAEDENEDELSYEVKYRREGDNTWKTLRAGLTDSIFVWETTTVPNGTYFVRVVASDSPSNPSERMLSGELDSSAFEIDNTPPEIAIRSVRADGGGTTIVFDVVDDHSPVQRVEMSEDGLQWRGVFPSDGMADSRSEHYQMTLNGKLGPRGLSLRATDGMNNVATTQVDNR